MNDTSRILITTADERTWPKSTDKAILFLGEWCKLFSKRHIWEKMDYRVVPYHWDDRKKLMNDYLYLKDVYEEILLKLSKRLNELHKTNHSVRYWRILIGPWLGYFIQMVFDRWQMIKKAINEYNIEEAPILHISNVEKVIPNDFEEFERMYVNDLWNGYIYGQLLKNWTQIKVREISIAEHSSTKFEINKLTFKNHIKEVLKKFSYNIFGLLGKTDKYFLISTYMPLKYETLLNFKLGQIPKLWRKLSPPIAEINLEMRNFKLDFETNDNFLLILSKMIPFHIPRIYLEGYSFLKFICNNLKWSEKPDIIFTSIAENADDVFKAWAAEKIEKGSKLIIGQHGGHFGIGLWEFTEEHVYKISDCFISWGWDDPERPQIIPVGNLKLIGKKIGWDPEGYAFMVEGTAPRYSYRMFSIPVASQWLSYFEDQFLFVKALPDKIRKKLLVRLYSSIADYGWAELDRWREKFPDVELDYGKTPIMKLIKKSRLYISTYNATTFLESLALNVPTVIFWNPKYFELRESAVPYFNRMKEVGIFHETPESAAIHVAKVWENVAEWWHSKEVQDIRQDFCERYSRVSVHTLEMLKKTLQRIISNGTN